MMRAYNSRIMPVIRNLSDEYYIRDIHTNTPEKFYNDKEVRKLINEYNLDKDKRILKDLIDSFGKYVISIAKNYQEQGLSLGDLISEGLLGLVQSIEKYDTTNPTKFVTYSNTVISRYMREALDYNNNIVRLPKNIRNKRMKIRELIHSLRMKGKTEEEIMDAINEEDRVFYLMPEIYTRKSIDEISGQEDESADLSELQDTELTLQDLKEDLENILTNKLTPDERDVNCCTFGIGMAYPITSIRDISKYLNLQKTMVKNLRDSANQKLREDDCIEIFTKYI